jgi:hypothetical protein
MSDRWAIASAVVEALRRSDTAALGSVSSCPAPIGPEAAGTVPKFCSSPRREFAAARSPYSLASLRIGVPLMTYRPRGLSPGRRRLRY